MTEALPLRFFAATDVGKVRDQLLQLRILVEEVLAVEGAVGGGVGLELAVDGRVHLVDEHAVDVPGEELVPFASPDHLDDVPAGAAE